MLKKTIFLLSVICLAIIKADSETSNEIEQKPPIKLDPALRRALLKAIENLENEAELSDEETTTENSTTDDAEILTTGDETATIKNGKDTNKDQEPSVQYHSFVIDGQKAFDSSKSLDGNKISRGKEKVLDPISDEDIELKETSNLNALTQTRSIQSNVIAETKVKTSAKVAEVTTQKPTTTKPTTPKPIYNEDGENIEELENHEVQVFQAPLVAAFTVHQDSRGLPRKVVPIYKEAVRAPITPALPVTRMHLASIKQNPQPTEQPLIQQAVPFNQPTQYQLYLQQQLEQKQRLLEEQLQKLQTQQRQHEELLKHQQLIQQQQFLYTQKEQQRQHERFLEEQQKYRQQQFLEQQNLQAQNLIQTNNVRQLSKPGLSATSVTFQPSISLQANPDIVKQQLPHKEAVDFLVHLRSGQPTPFPLQQTAPSVPNQHLQVPHEKPFPNTFLDKTTQNPSSIRVFRQDSSTGNFGLNTNDVFPRNNNFNGNFNKRIPFRPNQPRYRHDDELRQLLFQSGLTHGGRSQEDLSIISKVLSLNHGIGARDFYLNNNRDFLFGESKRVESKIKTGSNGNS